MNLLISELQQAVVATRMQPVGNLFGRLPRMVRDLATTCGKQVELIVSGGDTELDKTLLEGIRDPLTHIVRNSVDHGLETPAERIESAKSPKGQVSITARHEGGQVVIEITDDGRGLDLERIARKAVDAGLIGADFANSMSDRELANLIFHPGLSTAESVTTVSGRGVGMDVVKRSIDDIGGAVDIESVAGEGTTLTLRIPLTLAIIPALRVRCGGQRYLIPQLNVVELHKLDENSEPDLIGDTLVYRLRGDLLSIVHWSDVLPTATPHTSADGRYLVVLHAHGANFGFLVDGVESTEEIVVKPLRAHIKDVDAFAGSTVLGDGSVALILDPTGLAKSSGLGFEMESDIDPGDISLAGSEHPDSVLVCDVGERRIGFTLDSIDRLENFSADQFDLAAGEKVVQYRGTLMRVVDPSVLLGDCGPNRSSSVVQTVVVLRSSEIDGLVGLTVDRIREVYETDLSAGRAGPEPVRTSIPLGGVVTDVLDAPAIRSVMEGAGIS